MQRATAASGAWQYLLELEPDVALLQEVGAIPKEMEQAFSCIHRKASTKSGGNQRFGTAILVKGKILTPIPLSSQWPWVNEEVRRFSGNLVACKASIHNRRTANILSVYSPAWPIDADRLRGIDVTQVKLTQNPELWVTELMWAVLLERNREHPWIVGGDLNASVTFDELWGPKPRGNQEILDRMRNLGFEELLHRAKGELTPTFKNSKDKQVVHQIDHLFVEEAMVASMTGCDIGSADLVFGNSLSDHLPIIADFDIEEV